MLSTQGEGVEGRVGEAAVTFTYEDLAPGVRIYCGDCLEVLPTLEAGSADAVVTDPPYGHNNQDGDLQQAIHAFPGALWRSTDNIARPITNDGPEANNLFRAALPEWKRLLVPGGVCCCCGGGGGPDPQFAR